MKAFALTTSATGLAAGEMKLRLENPASVFSPGPGCKAPPYVLPDKNGGFIRLVEFGEPDCAPGCAKPKSCGGCGCGGGCATAKPECPSGPVMPGAAPLRRYEDIAYSGYDVDDQTLILTKRHVDGFVDQEWPAGTLVMQAGAEAYISEWEKLGCIMAIPKAKDCLQVKEGDWVGDPTCMCWRKALKDTVVTLDNNGILDYPLAGDPANANWGPCFTLSDLLNSALPPIEPVEPLYFEPSADGLKKYLKLRFAQGLQIINNALEVSLGKALAFSPTGAIDVRHDDTLTIAGNKLGVNTCDLSVMLPSLVADYSDHEIANFYAQQAAVPYDGQWHTVGAPITVTLAQLQAMAGLNGQPAMRSTDNAVVVRIDTQVSLDNTAGTAPSTTFAVTRHTVSSCNGFFRRSAVRSDQNTGGGIEEPTNARIESYTIPLDADDGFTVLHELLGNAAVNNVENVVSTLAVRVLEFKRIAVNPCYDADPVCFGVVNHGP